MCHWKSEEVTGLRYALAHQVMRHEGIQYPGYMRKAKTPKASKSGYPLAHGRWHPNMSHYCCWNPHYDHYVHQEVRSCFQIKLDILRVTNHHCHDFNFDLFMVSVNYCCLTMVAIITNPLPTLWDHHLQIRPFQQESLPPMTRPSWCLRHGVDNPRLATRAGQSGLSTLLNGPLRNKPSLCLQYAYV